MFSSAVLLVIPGIWGDLAGLLIAAAVIVWQRKASTFASDRTKQMSG